MRVTIPGPADHINDAQDVAMVLGFGPADAQTYVAPGWQDAQGNLYACASLPVGPDFVSNATSPLERPEWDQEPYQVNMAGANRAQALVPFWQPTEESPEPPLANPSAITAVVGDDGVLMLTAMGLTPMPQEDAV